MRARILFLLVALAGAAAARADDPCDGFAWDVRVERGLFAREAQPATAGSAVAQAPELAVTTPYALQLIPQEQVQFAVPPGKKAVPAGAHGGLVRTRITRAGRVRISLDAAAWIDVVVGGQPLPSQAFQGRAGCNAPHKVVEFELPAGPVLIQLSAAQPDRVRLTVTEAPASAR
jgi:hypothetical protein